MKRNTDPNDDIIKILPGMNFTVVHKLDDEPDMLEFKLHNHDDIYEIVFLLSGDCEFVVEGNTYKIRPHDMVFTRPFEFHHIVCLSSRTYERIILYIKADYFRQHDCGELLDIFVNRELGTGNIVPADITDNSIRECLNRIFRYYTDKAYKIADACVCEFLYLLNKSKRAETDAYAKNERIRDIIMYINNNLTEELRLDDISRRFFIDKHYLCKSFKKNTGFTVSQYINYKRILLVQELHRGGQTLLQASLNAGFNSYAHFYKMYIKQMGKPPKSMT
ncbi:MAG: helix-turn-helix domain-containing protein [Candidatus Ornithomonoglobus sp.]